MELLERLTAHRRVSPIRTGDHLLCSSLDGCTRFADQIAARMVPILLRLEPQQPAAAARARAQLHHYPSSPHLYPSSAGTSSFTATCGVTFFLPPHPWCVSRWELFDASKADMDAVCAQVAALYSRGKAAYVELSPAPTTGGGASSSTAATAAAAPTTADIATAGP